MVLDVDPLHPGQSMQDQFPYGRSPVMTLGISALTCRLDSDVPADAPGGVNWKDFLDWYGTTRPAFAGKYLIGSPWRWVRGEASSLIAPAIPGAALKLVPIQPSDPIRQATTGILGDRWGGEDGRAIGDVIDRGLTMGEFELDARKPVPVYLEVVAGTALSAEYWPAGPTRSGRWSSPGSALASTRYP
jgi:hypothetical protein